MRGVGSNVLSPQKPLSRSSGAKEREINRSARIERRQIGNWMERMRMRECHDTAKHYRISTKGPSRMRIAYYPCISLGSLGSKRLQRAKSYFSVSGRSRNRASAKREVFRSLEMLAMQANFPWAVMDSCFALIRSHQCSNAYGAQ